MTTTSRFLTARFGPDLARFAERIDDGSIARALLLRDFHGGCRAFTRDLLPLDPDALAQALIGEGDQGAARDSIRQMRGWLDQLDGALRGRA
jgi:hypothetical protein